MVKRYNKRFIKSSYENNSADRRGADVHTGNLPEYLPSYSQLVLLGVVPAPDLGFIGYAINTRVGAFTYNLLHHKGLAIIFYFTGLYFSRPELQLTGLVLFGHSSFDRMLGYGFKYRDSFQNTHLDIVGRKI